MSIIPKIKLSSGRKREKCDLSFDSGTTTNFGFVQPTMAREMMPNSKFEVSVDTRVLNAPMPVPTYGRIALLHKHVFVPYVDVCPQFDAFLAAQTYKPGIGTAYIPNSLPEYRPVTIAQYVLSHYADWSIHVRYSTDHAPTGDPTIFDDVMKINNEYQPILLDGTKKDATALTAVKFAFNSVIHPDNWNAGYHFGRNISQANWTAWFSGLQQLLPSAPLLDGNYRGSNDTRPNGNLLLGGWMFTGDNSLDTSDSNWNYQDYSSLPNGKIVGNPSNDYVSIEGADFICKFGVAASNVLDYVVAFRLTPAGKRFVSICKGLGYQFTPNLYGKVDNDNWLKFFAYYKSWFNCYRPKREMSFTTSTCYEMIKLCEGSDANTQMYKPDNSLPADNVQVSETLRRFVDSLCLAMYYYLPQDYYGMAVTTPNANYMSLNGELGAGEGLNVYYQNLDSSPSNSANQFIQMDGSSSNSKPTVYGAKPSNGALDSLQPAAMQMALRILKYVNKNTIVGRSIHDYIKVHFGVSLSPNHDLETVYTIGDVSIPIDINIVTSTASTAEDSLGSYAARGLGYNKDGNKFVFENEQNFGVWLCLTTIIPKSGYYQGVLRENNALRRYDFFTPEFDALGYDILLRGELSADYPVQTTEFNQVSDPSFDLRKAFGFVPRYSHYKVSRNILAGDLSLRSGQTQYGGYSLDRKIPYETSLPYWIYNSDEQKVYQFNRLAKPLFIPSVVYDNFRRLDSSDKLGNYNRMFYNESVRDDHFIINSTFKVDAWLPAMSLSESFDTITNEDGKVIDVTHS